MKMEFGDEASSTSLAEIFEFVALTSLISTHFAPNWLQHFSPRIPLTCSLHCLGRRYPQLYPQKYAPLNFLAWRRLVTLHWLSFRQRFVMMNATVIIGNYSWHKNISVLLNVLLKIKHRFCAYVVKENMNIYKYVLSHIIILQQWYMSYRFCWHISLLCVQWKTPDVGQRNCLKHVAVYSKNRFEKLVHLVGFIIRIYHDAPSFERKIWIFVYLFIFTLDTTCSSLLLHLHLITL